MNKMGEDNSIKTLTSSSCQLLIVGMTIGISITAIFAGRLPWIEWIVYDPILGEKTEYTNIFWMLPRYRFGVVTSVGALRNDGVFALTVGWAARFVVAFILVTSIWLIIRNTHGRQPLILLLLLPFVCFFIFELLWVHLWVIDEVWLYQHESLPRLTRMDWKSPLLLTSCFLIQAVLIVIVKSREDM